MGGISRTAGGLMDRGTCQPGPASSATCARRRWCLRLVLGLLLAASLLGASLYADPPAGPPECPVELKGPPVPEKGPRPPTGPQSIAAFIDDLSSNDSAF